MFERDSWQSAQFSLPLLVQRTHEKSGDSRNIRKCSSPVRPKFSRESPALRNRSMACHRRRRAAADEGGVGSLVAAKKGSVLVNLSTKIESPDCRYP